MDTHEIDPTRRAAETAPPSARQSTDEAPRDLDVADAADPVGGMPIYMKVDGVVGSVKSLTLSHDGLERS